MDNFDLRKFLIENKLTSNSRQLQEVNWKGLAAGAAMALGTLGAQGQETSKTVDDYQKSIDSLKTVVASTPKEKQEKRATLEKLVKARNDVRLAPEKERQKAQIAAWLSDNPGKTEKDYWKMVDKRQSGPDAQLAGLEVGKACKRGDTKGSCTTGQTMGGGSLKDTK